MINDYLMLGVCSCIHVLSGHVSAVTSLGFTPNGETMLRWVVVIAIFLRGLKT